MERGEGRKRAREDIERWRQEIQREEEERGRRGDDGGETEWRRELVRRCEREKDEKWERLREDQKLGKG
eukprot:568868-Amorphochlora_amoeboformis.AAC.2